MANETSKQMLRRCADRRFATRWIKGHGIDIGCGPDPLSNLADYFPLMSSLRPWDLPDGDAMLMESVTNDTFDFVHSSYFLEKQANPEITLKNWIRICKPEGYLIIIVPEEDLYEQGVWPSTFNSDHKWTFTIHKNSSWSPKSINVTGLLAQFSDQVEIIKIEKLDSGYVYNQARYDQTLGTLAESAIEFVLKKRPLQPAQKIDIEQTFQQAHALHEKNKIEEALENYNAILAINPSHVPTLNNVSLLLELDQAERYLNRALSIDPNYVDSIINLGFRLLDRERPDEALEKFQRALSLSPDHLIAINGVGKAYEKKGDFASAVDALTQKLKLDANKADTLYQIGLIHEITNNTNQVISCCEQALVINPSHIQAHVLLGRQHMKRGNYDKGAEGLAWIWKEKIEESQIGLFVDKEGNPIRKDGKTVVVFSDSGLGDTVQFVRYAQWIHDLGAKVIVECQPPLMNLLSHCSYIQEVHAKGKYEGDFDLKIPMHNLIGAFRSTPTSVPSHVPYIQPTHRAKLKFQERLSMQHGLNVGICWYGNSKLPRNSHRSIPLEQLSSLLSLEGINFYSLHQEASPSGQLIDWSEDLADIDATAALIASLDLVITVDSLVAHLAGALGRPVWLLNRYDSCWRWLENRNDSPWYPTLTQFRQLTPGDWSHPLQGVASSLAQLQTSVNQKEICA